MLSRRKLIGDVCLTSVITALPIGIAFTAPSVRPAACIVDRRLPGSAKMSARFSWEAAAGHLFADDPGELWMSTLQPGLRNHPAAIAGFTSAPTLFCLQYLTRDYGLTLKAHAKGAVALDTIGAWESELLDLHDPRYNDPRAAYTWLLAPRGE